MKKIRNLFSNIKYIIIVLTIMIYLSNFLFSSELKVNTSEIFSFVPTFNYFDIQYKYPRVMTSDQNAKAVIINTEHLTNLLLNDIEEFTFENYPISFEQKSDVKFTKATAAVGNGTRWIRNTENGEILENGFEPIFYVGKIVGEENSKVTMFMYKNEFYSIIERIDNENFSIAPTNGITEKNVHVLTTQSTSLLGMDYNPFLDVHFDGQEEIDFEKFFKKANETQSTDLLQADIIIEATNDFYKLFNNYDKTVAYIAAVMSHSSQIFETNINVTLFVPQVIIQEDYNNDPYKNTTQIFDRLSQVREYWRTKTVKRSLVCLMTDIDYQGGSGGYRIGGVSLGLGTLCKNNQAYCVFGMQGHYVYPTSNYTWDVSVSAHEMGHAFGGPHTHSCYYRPNMIDTCITRDFPQAGSDGCVTTGSPIPRLGTLMSYCHLTNSTRSVGLYFHDRDKPILRGFAESASCLKKAIDPTLILLYPIGGTILFPGDKIAIRWSSNKVESVAIKYSLDNGKNWTWVEPYADAKTGQFLWDVPDTFSNQVLFHISDSFDAYVNDQVLTPCSINKPTYILEYPQENSRLGQNENYLITWKQLYISSTKIEFTSNIDLGIDKAEWSELIPNISTNTYSWKVPEIISNNCMIRLTGKSENGGQFVIYSGKFAIGKAFCSLISPKSGDKLCANSNFEIKWNSDFVTNLYIQYTTDEGNTWRHIYFNAIKGNLGKYTWKVPSYYSDKCYFRIAQFENKTNILAQNESSFSIDSCETGINELKRYEDEILSISDISPNPANSKIKIKYKYLSAIFKTIDFSIVDSDGKKLIIDSVLPNKYGESQIEFDVSSFSQGNYFVVMTSGSNTISKNLIVIK